MPTFNNGESGSSVRTKLNTIINKVEGAATIENDILFGDNDKAIFGAGSDLQIYHDGSNSFVKDAGTGNLILQGDNSVQLRSVTGNQAYFFGAYGGASYIYHAGSAKLATTSTGVDVTGTVTADGLTVGVDDSITFGATSETGIYRTNSGNDLTMQHWGNLSMLIDSDNNDANSRQFLIGRNSQDASTAEKIALFSETGDISFYEDTGTTPKFFWDASAESLGIGTSSPSNTLHLQSTTPVLRLTDSDTGADALITASSSVGALTFSADNGDEVANTFMNFKVDGSEAMRIDSSGNVGIGTTSPGSKLSVVGLPTSSAGLSAGDIWNDSGTLKIV